MKTKRLVALTLAMLMASTSLAGCAGNNAVSTPAAPASKAAESKANGTAGVDPNTTATLTVFTHRTDMADVFDGYAEKFKEKYPNVTLKFDSSTDYQGDQTKRMSTQDYGDVFVVPANIATPKSNFPTYCEPLGKYDDLKNTYNYLDDFNLDGTVYAIPTGANALGFVYNAKVLKDAGVTKLPETTDEFMAMLKAIKEKTKAIPFYTNYKDGWPLSNHSHEILIGLTQNVNYLNDMLTNKKEFLPGSAEYASLKILYDAVKNKYCEPDPITSNWENSKQMIADGKIGVMCLGSWAVGQFKAFSKTPDDIKFMPAPARKDGKALIQIGHDYGLAVSKYSKNKEIAKEFIKFFVETYPNDSNMLSALKNAELPDFLKDVQNAELKEAVTMSADQAKACDTIQKESLLNLYDNTWVKTVVEIGLGTKSQSFDDYMTELNKKWVKGIEKASK
jgi:ABC-type glycerol-3-phosphate transport system substrate-binding protein